MNEPVRLKLARREFWSGAGMSGTFMPVTVKVKNIAFTKDVSIHYTPDNVNWKDVPIGFLSHFGDYDVFSGSVGEQVLRFVVRYTVAGQTFFDNNSGWDYQFASNLAVVGGNVVLSSAMAKQGTQAGGGFTVTTSWLEGEILVNNLGFIKHVGVRLSADGGATWHDTQGAFFPGSHTADGTFVGTGSEVWKFKTPELNLDTSSPEFRFAVFYEDVGSGQVFWDNNFGQDYKISKNSGTTIE